MLKAATSEASRGEGCVSSWVLIVVGRDLGDDAGFNSHLSSSSALELSVCTVSTDRPDSLILFRRVLNHLEDQSRSQQYLMMITMQPYNKFKQDK